MNLSQYGIAPDVQKRLNDAGVSDDMIALLAMQGNVDERSILGFYGIQPYTQDEIDQANAENDVLRVAREERAGIVTADRDAKAQADADKYAKAEEDRKLRKAEEDKAKQDALVAKYGQLNLETQYPVQVGYVNGQIYQTKAGEPPPNGFIPWSPEAQAQYLQTGVDPNAGSRAAYNTAQDTRQRGVDARAAGGNSGNMPPGDEWAHYNNAYDADAGATKPKYGSRTDYVNEEGISRNVRHGRIMANLTPEQRALYLGGDYDKARDVGGLANRMAADVYASGRTAAQNTQLGNLEGIGKLTGDGTKAADRMAFQMAIEDMSKVGQAKTAADIRGSAAPRKSANLTQLYTAGKKQRSK